MSSSRPASRGCSRSRPTSGCRSGSASLPAEAHAGDHRPKDDPIRGANVQAPAGARGTPFGRWSVCGDQGPVHPAELTELGEPERHVQPGHPGGPRPPPAVVEPLADGFAQSSGSTWMTAFTGAAASMAFASAFFFRRRRSTNRVRWSRRRRSRRSPAARFAQTAGAGRRSCSSVRLSSSRSLRLLDLRYRRSCFSPIPRPPSPSFVSSGARGGCLRRNFANSAAPSARTGRTRRRQSGTPPTPPWRGEREPGRDGEEQQRYRAMTPAAPKAPTAFSRATSASTISCRASSTCWRISVVVSPRCTYQLGGRTPSFAPRAGVSVDRTVGAAAPHAVPRNEPRVPLFERPTHRGVRGFVPANRCGQSPARRRSRVLRASGVAVGGGGLRTRWGGAEPARRRSRRRRRARA